MEPLTQRLLNDFQRNFPLDPAPFDRIARDLHTSTERVLGLYRQLKRDGAVSRIGPVFRPNTVGVSTLAAMAVPSAELERTAAVVNRFVQVNHNYEREHRYNLWFVVTAADRPALESALRAIESEAGYPVLVLPLVRDYHIDLGFRMRLDTGAAIEPDADAQRGATAADEPACHAAEDLIEAVQDGIPLVARPYRDIGRRLNWSEQAVIDALRDMLDHGVVKRLGVVVRHHELGYRANAMVVWDVPDERIDRLGEQLGRQDCVTLCYQRPRRLPDWPYNLFCMVHGRDRDEVRACIARMVEGLALHDVAHDLLFSGRRFKQRGARYRTGA
jgi:DNA-binding Lrp family transcriptional regulator